MKHISIIITFQAEEFDVDLLICAKSAIIDALVKTPESAVHGRGDQVERFYPFKVEMTGPEI